MAKKWLLSLERVSEKLQFKFGGVIHWANGVFNILEPNRQDNARMKVAPGQEDNDVVNLAQLKEAKAGGIRSISCPFSPAENYVVPAEAFASIPQGARVKEVNTYVETGSDNYEDALSFDVSLGGGESINGYFGTESDSFSSYDVPRKEITAPVTCTIDSSGLSQGSSATGYVEIVYAMPVS